MKWKLPISFDEGFTLIEIMIALVILSIGLIALAGMQVSAIKGNAFSKRMTTAVSIAEEKMEQIKNTPFANVQVETETEVTASNMKFTRKVTVENTTPPNPQLREIQVEVKWKDGSKEYSLPVSTIISQ